MYACVHVCVWVGARRAFPPKASETHRSRSHGWIDNRVVIEIPGAAIRQTQKHESPSFGNAPNIPEWWIVPWIVRLLMPAWG